MANEPGTTPRALDTGERVTIRKVPYRVPAHRYEASADVWTLPGANVDHHAVGATPDEAAQRLQEFVQSRRPRHGR